MKIYDHWAKTGKRAITSDGHRYWLVAWGGSNTDVKGAEANAKQTVLAMQQRLSEKGFLDNGYSYDHDRPLKEKVIKRIGDYDSPRIAITRNRYGSLVLNSANVFIADVDRARPLEVPKEAVVGEWILKHKPELLQKESERVDLQNAHREKIIQQNEQQHIEQAALAFAKFEQFHERFPSLSFRVYETAAGYRVIITNQTVEPGTEQSNEWLEALDSDKLYCKLCVKQHCYRARLTPKPWRLPDCKSNVFFPNGQYAEKYNIEDWLERYDEQSKDFAVCKLLKTYGANETSGEASDIIEEVAEVLELHDSYVLNENSSGQLA